MLLVLSCCLKWCCGCCLAPICFRLFLLFLSLFLPLHLLGVFVLAAACIRRCSAPTFKYDVSFKFRKLMGPSLLSVKFLEDCSTKFGEAKHFQAHRNYTKCLQYMEFRTILCRARKTAFIYLLNNLMYRLFKAILFLSLATFCSSCMHNFGHEVHAAWIRGKVIPTRNPKPIWGLKTPKKQQYKTSLQ